MAWNITASEPIVLQVGNSIVKVDRRIENLGAVVPGVPLSASLTFSNTRGGPVILRGSPKLSCACLTPDLRSDELVPENGKRKVVIKLPEARPKAGLMHHAQFSLGVPEDSTIERLLEYRIVGSVIPSKEVSPSELIFDLSSDGQLSERVIRLSESANDRFQVSSVDLGGLFESAAVEIDSQPSSGGLKDYLIRIQSRGTVWSGGAESGEILITTTSLFGEIVTVRYTVRK